MAKKKPKKTPEKEQKETQIVTVTDPKVEAELAEIRQEIEQRGEDAISKLTPGQLEILRVKYAAGAPDDEIRVFLMVCNRRKLDPFKGQIFLVKRWNSNLGRDTYTPQTSIDGLRSVAERAGNYAGNDDPIFDDENNPKKATVTVWKIVQGQRVGFTASARWSQYFPGEKMGFMWNKMPHLMLGKCAEALALRKAFPDAGGLYITEEMEQAGTVATGESREQASFERLVDNAKKAGNLEQLKSAREKMEKSQKYTDEQKQEYINAADQRIKELTDLKESADKTDKGEK